MVRLYEHAADHQQNGGYGGAYFEAGIDRLETLPGGWKDRVTTIVLWPNEAIRIWPDDAGRGEPREYYWYGNVANRQASSEQRAGGWSGLRRQLGVEDSSEKLIIELHRDHAQYEFHGLGGGGWNDAVNSFQTFRTDGNVPWPERSDWGGEAVPVPQPTITVKPAPGCQNLMSSIDTQDGIEVTTYRSSSAHDAKCEGWAASGECDKNPLYMKVHCAAACGSCNKLEAYKIERAGIEEEARRQAEEDADEEARLQAEEEARRQADEEARRQAENDAWWKQREEANRQQLLPVPLPSVTPPAAPDKNAPALGATENEVETAPVVSPEEAGGQAEEEGEGEAEGEGGEAEALVASAAPADAATAPDERTENEVETAPVVGPEEAGAQTEPTEETEPTGEHDWQTIALVGTAGLAVVGGAVFLAAKRSR